jgi:hypothetical protein
MMGDGRRRRRGRRYLGFGIDVGWRYTRKEDLGCSCDQIKNISVFFVTSEELCCSCRVRFGAAAECYPMTLPCKRLGQPQL